MEAIEITVSVKCETDDQVEVLAEAIAKSAVDITGDDFAEITQLKAKVVKVVEVDLLAIPEPEAEEVEDETDGPVPYV